MIRARSTNERVLARHHAFLKRRPAAVEPHRNGVNDAVRGSEDDDDDDDDDEEPDTRGRLGLGTEDTSVHPPRPTPVVPPPVSPPPAKSVPVPPTVVTPPVRPVPTTTVPKVPPPVPTSAPPKPPVVSSTPVTTSSTPVLTTPTSTPTPTLPQTANRGVSSSSSGTAAPESSGSDAASSSSGSHGVSPGAIGAVVAVLVVVALVVIAFFVRKHHQHRRAMKRNTWGAGLVPSLENRRQSVAYNDQSQSDRPMSPYGGVSEHERLANVPTTSQMSQTPAPYALGSPGLAPVPNAYAAYGPPVLNHPSSAYNPSMSPPPISPFVAPLAPAASLRSVTPSMGATHPAPAVEYAVVARTFIPSLPDELHISNGEQIRVLSAYDDGWALCANSQGEQGVVPLECLQRSGGAPVEMQLQPDSGIGESNRTSRRISSLAPNVPGTY